jgi:hypothetical protein
MSHALAHLNPDAMVVEDLPILARHLRRLAHYCDARAREMNHRAAGEIRDAQRAETDCRMLYEKLPAEWKW